jgi:TolB-like protein/DNA-binding winged helix-turn-helix (wHTH) protein
MMVRESVYYDFLNFRLDVEKQLLLKNGEPVQLTNKAFQILLLLVQNSGQTTKKEDIFALLWADSFVEDANLTQYIYVLRKALGQTPDGNSFIETVPKQGYRFTVEVLKSSVVADEFDSLPKGDLLDNNEIADELPSLQIPTNGNCARRNLIHAAPSKNGNGKTATANSHYQTENAPHQQAAPASEKRRSFFSRHRLLSFLLFAAVALASFAGIYYLRQKPSVVSAQNIKSIAVLPFKPIGGEVDKEKLGLGMADAVIMRLSQINQIEVRPTSAVFRYTDKPGVHTATAGRELGVDAVLEGTVQCDGERVRVLVQLIRTTDGKSLWAESFQEKVFDVFTVQDMISVKVATALALNLTKQQEQLLVQRSTNNAEAFQSYQLGIYFWNKRGNEDLLKAARYFQKAIELDANYAQAYAMLADSYNMLGFYGFENVGEMKTRARAAAEKSLALNDSLGDTYVALAMMHILAPPDYEQAARLLERAITSRAAQFFSSFALRLAFTCQAKNR